MTDIDKAKVISAIQEQVKIQFRTLMKKVKFLVFHGVVLWEDLSIDYQLLMSNWYWRS